MFSSFRAKLFIAFAIIIVISGTSFGFQSGNIPTPESIIGFKPGTDYKMANWDQISTYFKALGSASDRVDVMEVGETEMGNQMLVALISSAENLRNLDRIKEIRAKLADPRKTSGAELPRLVSDGKAVVLMTFSLHATEIGATQMSPILAYQLATGNSDEIRNILDNVVIVMFPSANPDGVMMTADFYMKQNPASGINVEPLPRLYSKYTGHDNNRDWYMLTQKESKLIAHQMYDVWFPEIVLDMHQMGNGGARFFLPPFDDPVNPVINPLIVRELQLLGGYLNLDLIEGGYPWVENQSRFSMWWHGGMRTAPYFHNMVGILSEAASANLASPILVGNSSRGQQARNIPIPTINYPVPWKHDRDWTVGDIVEQDRIAAFAVLKGTARNKDMFLRNFYNMNKTSIEQGKSESPYAYIMPADQHDPGAFRYFLEIMLRQKTEFFEATSDFSAVGQKFNNASGEWERVSRRNYPKGSIIVYLSQPSRGHVEAIFGIQKFPVSEGQPYDITGWTLPLQMGVNYVRTENSFNVNTKPYKEAAHFITGRTSNKIKTYLLGANSIDHYKALNLLMKKGYKVKIANEAFKIGEDTFPAGTKILKHSRKLENDINELKKSLTLELHELSKSVKAKTSDLKKPKIAMVDAPNSMPVGWMRWIMDTNAFEYTMINRDDFLAGNLKKRFDVILFTSNLRARGEQGEPPAEIKAGLQEFLDKKGTIVAWGSNADFLNGILDLGLENAVSRENRRNFSIPGSILKTKIDIGRPVTYGMQNDAFVFFGRGTTTWKSAAGEILGTYPDENPLVSGFALGQEFIQNTPCVIHKVVGKGNVVLIGFDPVFRAQPVATFKLVFNSIFMSGY